MKINAEIIGKIVTYVRTGSYIETAVVAAGISKQTYYQWMKAASAAEEAAEVAERKGEQSPRLTKQQKLCFELRDAIEKALAEGELSDLMTIRIASKRNWQAAAWRLERKFPDKWGRRDHLSAELSGPKGSPIPVSTGPLTSADLKAAVLSCAEELENEQADGNHTSAEADATPATPAQEG